MVSNTLSTRKVGLTAYLTNDAVKDQITKVVGGKNSTRFTSSVISAVQVNPMLQECDNASILSCALQGEALQLPPSPQLGYYYMVPFNDKKKGIKVAHFILSARGYKQLAMRSGQYIDIDCIYVREGEYVGRDKYTGKQKFEFVEDDVEREKLPIIGYLAYFETKQGFRKQLYWTKEQVEKHADRYSQAFSLEAYNKLKRGEIPKSDLWKYSSYWYTAFDEMAEKTVIKKLLKDWALLTTELEQAIEADQAVIREDGSKDYVDIVEAPNSPQIDKVEETDTNTEKTSPQAQSEATEPQQTDVAAALFS